MGCPCRKPAVSSLICRHHSPTLCLPWSIFRSALQLTRLYLTCHWPLLHISKWFVWQWRRTEETCKKPRDGEVNSMMLLIITIMIGASKERNHGRTGEEELARYFRVWREWKEVCALASEWGAQCCGLWRRTEGKGHVKQSSHHLHQPIPASDLLSAKPQRPIKTTPNDDDDDQFEWSYG